MVRVQELLAEVLAWADLEPDVRGIVLVGSHARSDATTTSDVDLVIIVDDLPARLDDVSWLEAFGDVTTRAPEDWGLVQSLRTVNAHDVELEFGLTTAAWTGLPLDDGTRRVLTDGHRILYDPDGLLRRAAEAATRPAPPALACPDPVLDDGIVRLRPWTDRDLACVKAVSDEGRIPLTTTVPDVYSRETGLDWIARQHTRAANGEGWSLAIGQVDTDEAIGCIVLLMRPQPAVAGVGYWLAPDARGHGYASRALRLLTGWGLSAAGLARVEAWVEPDNAASVATLQRSDFTEEGLLRSFLQIGDHRADMLVYSRIAQDQR